MTPLLGEVGQAFVAWKLDMIAATNLARDALHVHIGLAAFVAVRLAWRWRFGWLMAWCAALVLTLAGEYIDWQNELARQAVPVREAHLHDIWNTMLWPSVLALVGRWLQPRSATAPATGTTAPAEPSGEDAEQRLEQT